MNVHKNNRLSMLDEENDSNCHYEDAYETYVKEFGYPVPLLKKSISELLSDTESLPETIRLVTNTGSNTKLDRVEKVLSLVNIEIESETEIADMKAIISSFSDIFHLEGELLKPTDILYVSIPLKPDTSPVNIKQYRLSPPQQLEIKRKVNELLANKIIRVILAANGVHPSSLFQRNPTSPEKNCKDYSLRLSSA